MEICHCKYCGLEFTDGACCGSVALSRHAKFEEQLRKDALSDSAAMRSAAATVQELIVWLRQALRHASHDSLCSRIKIGRLDAPCDCWALFAEAALAKAEGNA